MVKGGGVVNGVGERRGVHAIELVLGPKWGLRGGGVDDASTLLENES